MPQALTIGELLIDFVSSTTDVSLASAPGFIKAPGGAPANVAVGLAKLGVDTGFIGKVGTDPFGDFLTEVVAHEGVDTTCLLQDAEARTTLAFVATRSDGKKDITFYRNPGADIRLCAEELPRDYVQSCRVFHYGSVSLSHSPAREATLTAAQWAQEAGALVSYDPNLRLPLWDDAASARHWIWEAMPYANLAKLAEEEWDFVTGTTDFVAGSEMILSKGPQLVIVTRGADGCYYDNGTYRGELAAFAVDARDALGAGDGFVAGLLCQLMGTGKDIGRIPEESLVAALRFASAVGALTTQKPGVIPALPTRREVEQFLDEHRA